MKIFSLRMSICSKEKSTSQSTSYEKISASDHENPKHVYSKNYKEFLDDPKQKPIKEYRDNDQVKVPKEYVEKPIQQNKNYIIKKACLILLIWFICLAAIVFQIVGCGLSSQYHQVIYGPSSSQPYRFKDQKFTPGYIASYFNETSDKYTQINEEQKSLYLTRQLSDTQVQTFNFSVLINDTSSQKNPLQHIIFSNSTTENFNITTQNSQRKQVYIQYPHFTYQTSVTYDKESLNGRSLWVMDMADLSTGKFGESQCNCDYQLIISNTQDNNSISPFVIRDIRGVVTFQNWTYLGNLVLDYNAQNQYIEFQNINYVQQIVIPKIYKELTLDFTKSNANDVRIVLPSNKQCIMNQSLAGVDSQNICQLKFQGMINNNIRMDYVQPISYSSYFVIHVLTDWQFQQSEELVDNNQIFKIYNTVLDYVEITMQDLENYNCQFQNQLTNSIDIVCN